MLSGLGAAKGVGSVVLGGIIAGGYVYPNTGPTTASEEFTGETTALNVKTLTQS